MYNITYRKIQDGSCLKATRQYFIPRKGDEVTLEGLGEPYEITAEVVKVSYKLAVNHTIEYINVYLNCDEQGV